MDRSYLWDLSNELSQHIALDTDDGDTGCDGTLRYTLRWIDAHHLDPQVWMAWLEARGAWCDCGVVEEILLWDPTELGENTPVAPPVAFRNWPAEP